MATRPLRTAQGVRVTRPFDIVHIGYRKTGSSWFQQRLYPRVKSHRYIADCDEIKRTLVQPHDCASLVRHYDQVFGRGNVHVFAFEAFKENLRVFVAEFAERLGLELDLAEIQYGAANVAFRHRTVVLARLINRASYGAVTDKSYIPPSRGYRGIERFLMRFDTSWLGGRKLSSRETLGAEVVAFIEQFYAPSNRALAQRTGLPLARYGYPDASGHLHTALPLAAGADRRNPHDAEQEPIPTARTAA